MEKLTKRLIIFLLIGIILTVAPLIYSFRPQLSSNVEHWAFIASYFGGIMSPYIAVLALIALLSTLKQQSDQIALLKKQTQSNQIETMLSKIECDFATPLKETLLNLKIRGKEINYTFLDPITALAFPRWEEVIPNIDDLDPSKEYDYLSQEIMQLDLYTSASSYLKLIKVYAEKHEAITGSNILSAYYKKKYKTPYKRLHQKGFLKEPWE
ncbi:hypothetical protein Q4540_09295 [Pseudoalteromonas carrageenovora]|uniref:hypothetical protein n=1 Tax=Pseudoalteromonas carrageenovora TaxID=227 RepID=UPI0026E17CC9|nr:hypothetical protein [Pseudoalteromonas carrageenovora]MDO6636707.1 hypothetical protein [Pseudoalteromonas carrageenovora]MDO6648689.1 hypothetical protein [Pseudoalteromonas carrageenovora]